MAQGASRRRIIVKEILPNVIGPVIVLAALDLGTIILSIAGLNFLGLGVQPPTAEWGAMLRAAQPHLQTEPQLMLYPSAAIMLVVLSVNALLADQLRDALHPAYRELTAVHRYPTWWPANTGTPPGTPRASRIDSG